MLFKFELLNNRHFWFHFQICYPSQQVNQWISYRIPASAIYLLCYFKERLNFLIHGGWNIN